MLTEAGFAHEFNMISKKSLKCTGIPYTWKKGKNFQRLKVNPNTFLFSAILLNFSGFGQVASGLEKAFGPQNEAKPTDTNWTSFIIVTGLCFIEIGNFPLSIYRDPEVLEEWMTQTLNFDRLHMAERLGGSKMTRTIAKIGLLTCKITRLGMYGGMPWLIAVGGAILPGNPVNLGKMYPAKMWLSWIENHAGSVAWVPIRVLTFGWNYTNYYFLMRSWNMMVVGTVLGSISLSEAMLHFKRKFPKKGPYESTKLYREIQILEKLYNILMSNHLVFILLLAMLIEIVCALNVLDKGSSNLPMKMYFFWVMGNGVMCVVGLFGFCGNVFDTSNNSMEEIKCHTAVTKIVEGLVKFNSSKVGKEYQRVLKSLPLVKVNFGAVNFIEKMTPVMFQEFAGQRLVDCLLLDSSE